MGAPKDGSSLVGALIMKIITYWGVSTGALFGNYQLAVSACTVRAYKIE